MSVTIGRLQLSVHLIAGPKKGSLPPLTMDDPIVRTYAHRCLMAQIENERRGRLSAAMVAVGRLICPR